MKEGVVSLHWAIARARTNRQTLELDLVTPGVAKEAFFVPPSCITIYGEKDIRTLRDFLNDVLDEEENQGYTP